MDPLYDEARKRVKKKKSYYNELISYVFVSILLIFINVFTSPAYLWFLWAIVPWGLVLLMRGVTLAFDEKRRGWERKEMRKEISAMGGNPDDYIQDEKLELKDLKENPEPLMNDRGYRDSDLV